MVSASDALVTIKSSEGNRELLAVGLTLLGIVGSVVGVLAFLDARRNKRIKLLMYEQTAPFPLATARGRDSDYELSIHYKRGDGGEEVVDAAFVTYLVFANFGKEPIRAQDIAPSNPLRIEVEDVRVLDISLAGTHRDVNRIHLNSIDLKEHRASAEVSFDFLDFRDGGLIRVLSTARAKKLQLAGDIIGMPDGMSRTDQPGARGPWGKIGFGLWLVAQVIALIAVAYVYREVEGNWDNAWVLALPFIGLLLPLLGALFISETVWPTRTRSGAYPKELLPPGWIRRAVRMAPAEGYLLYPDFPVEEDHQAAADPAYPPSAASDPS